MTNQLHAHSRQFLYSRALRTALLTGLLAPVIALTNGCSSLRPADNALPKFYSLDNPVTARSQTAQTSAAAQSARLPAPTLLVSPTVAAAGFDSQRIIYTRVAHQLEYFSRSEWIDTPARMVGPLIVATLAATDAFQAVLPASNAAAGELRLNTEIVRLEQDFTTQPSQLRFTLRAYILDNATRRVVAWHEFDEVVAAASDAPQDGVSAANQAVQQGLQGLANFCVDAAHQWHAIKETEPNRDTISAP